MKLKELFEASFEDDESLPQEDDSEEMSLANAEDNFFDETEGDDFEDNEPESPDNVDFMAQSPERKFFAESLAGHTIRSADIEFSADGGNITLQLVSVSNPVEIAWNKSGKTVMSFRGRPMVLKK